MSQAALRALAETVREFIRPGVKRVVLICDDEGRHYGEGVLGLDARYLRDAVSTSHAPEPQGQGSPTWFERGVADERAAVVTWLRHQAKVSPEAGEPEVLNTLADCIERGEHRG